MVAGIFDGGKGADNALIVCDVVVGVERDVKVNLELTVNLGYSGNEVKG